MRFSQILRAASLTTLLLGVAGMAQAATNGSLLTQIKQHGVLKVGLEGTYPPFSFQDQQGQLTGFEVDFARALAAQLGVKAQFQPGKWDGMLAGLDAKRTDVVINQVIVTPERQKKYDFSQPYTVSGIQVLARKGEAGRFTRPADLAGKRVGLGLGTNYEQWLKVNVPTAKVRTYDDDPTKYQDLRAGRIDAILTDRLAAYDLVQKSGGMMAVAGKPFARQAAAVAMRKGDPAMLKAVNQAIEALHKNGTLSRLSQKWFKADVTQ